MHDLTGGHNAHCYCFVDVSWGPRLSEIFVVGVDARLDDGTGPVVDYQIGWASGSMRAQRHLLRTLLTSVIVTRSLGVGKPAGARGYRHQSLTSEMRVMSVQAMSGTPDFLPMIEICRTKADLRTPNSVPVRTIRVLASWSIVDAESQGGRTVRTR